MTKRSKFFSSLLIGTFLLSIASALLIRDNFAHSQLAAYAKSNPGITNVTIAWPRLISTDNKITEFEEQLSDWKLKSSFLIFREMSDKRGNSFYLVGTKNPIDFFANMPSKSNTKCNLASCEVLVAYPEGAQIPDLSGMGLEIIDSAPIAKRLPIPRDFGINTNIPILITSQPEALSRWEPGRYLPATYGWQISPNLNKSLKTTSYKEKLVALESSLTSNFPNVAINYPLNKLDTLIANQEHFDSLTQNALKVLFVIFLATLILIFSTRFTHRLYGPLLFVGLTLLIQQFWDFATLLQILSFFLIAITLLLLMIRFIDTKLLKRDFQTLTLLRSSFKSVTAISLLLILLSGTLLSSYQYLSRTKELRIQRIEAKVPFDFSLKISSCLDRPLDLGSLSEIESLASGTNAIPVIRNTATLFDEIGDEKQVNLLAIDDGKSWKEPEIKLPVGQELTIVTSGIAREIDLIVWLRTKFGGHISITATGSDIRRVTLPKSDLGDFSIVAFELQENPINAARREHALGESTGRSFDLLNGSGQIASISVDGRRAAIGKEWQVNDFPYALIDGPLILRPEVEQSFLPMVLSEDLRKEPNELRLSDEVSIPISKFVKGNYPGVESPYVIISLADYQAALSSTEPGSLDPLEVWIQSKNPEQFRANYSKSIFRNLKLFDKSELEKSQSNSPFWQSWQRLFYATLISLLILIFLSLAYFNQLLQKDFRGKSFELVRYFSSNPPNLRPIIFGFLAALIGGVPILILARLFSGLLA